MKNTQTSKSKHLLLIDTSINTDQILKYQEGSLNVAITITSLIHNDKQQQIKSQKLSPNNSKNIAITEREYTQTFIYKHLRHHI